MGISYQVVGEEGLKRRTRDVRSCSRRWWMITNNRLFDITCNTLHAVKPGKSIQVNSFLNFELTCWNRLAIYEDYEYKVLNRPMAYSAVKIFSHLKNVSHPRTLGVFTQWNLIFIAFCVIHMLSIQWIHFFKISLFRGTL